MRGKGEVERRAGLKDKWGGGGGGGGGVVLIIVLLTRKLKGPPLVFQISALKNIRYKGRIFATVAKFFSLH